MLRLVFEKTGFLCTGWLVERLQNFFLRIIKAIRFSLLPSTGWLLLIFILHWTIPLLSFILSSICCDFFIFFSLLEKLLCFWWSVPSFLRLWGKSFCFRWSRLLVSYFFKFRSFFCWFYYSSHFIFCQQIFLILFL